MDGAENMPLREPDPVPVSHPSPPTDPTDLALVLQHLTTAVGSQDDTMRRHEQVLTQWGAEMRRQAGILTVIQQALQCLQPIQPGPSDTPATQATPPTIAIPTFLTSPTAPASTATSSNTPSESRPVPSREPRLPTPERYSGDPKGCRGFLTQCHLSFDLQPAAYPTEHSRVAYVITLLTGKALAWATALYESKSSVCGSFESFSKEMLKVFSPEVSSRTAANKLLQLRQGRQSAADYAIQFRTLAAESGWGEQALLATFYCGLADRIKDQLASWEEAENLESLISRVIRLDNRLQERNKAPRSMFSFAVPAHSTPAVDSSDGGPEPMQLGGTRLSQAERERRMKERCCLYCGKPGHFRSNCPELQGKAKPRPAPGDL